MSLLQNIVLLETRGAPQHSPGDQTEKRIHQDPCPASTPAVSLDWVWLKPPQSQAPRLHGHNLPRHGSCWKRKAALGVRRGENLAVKTQNSPSAVARRSKRHLWKYQGHHGAPASTSPGDEARQHGSNRNPSPVPPPFLSPPLLSVQGTRRFPRANTLGLEVRGLPRPVCFPGAGGFPAFCTSPRVLHQSGVRAGYITVKQLNKTNK